MTTKLTHEQAALLRLISVNDELFNRDELRKHELSLLLDICFSGCEGLSYLVLNNAGREALAEYNQQHRIVSTKDLYWALETFDNPANHIDSQSLAAKQDARAMAIARLRAVLEGK